MPLDKEEFEFYGYVVWPRIGGTPWFQTAKPTGYVEYDIVYRKKK